MLLWGWVGGKYSLIWLDSSEHFKSLRLISPPPLNEIFEEVALFHLIQISQSLSTLRAKFSRISTAVFVSYVKTTSFSFPPRREKKIYYMI